MADDILDEHEEKIDYRELLFKYLIHWPWFVASVITCIVVAAVYLYLSTPVYNVTASIMIKDESKGGNTAGTLSAFEDINLFSSGKNIDNEIEVLHSKSLLKDVVCELQLYTRYFVRKGLVRQELYNESPITVSLQRAEAERLTLPALFTLQPQANGSLDVTYEVDDQEHRHEHFDELPALLTTDVGTFRFALNADSTLLPHDEIQVVVVNPLSVAKGYVANLTIEPTSKTTSVATISLKDSYPRRGEDFINKLIELYNIDANNDKNEIAESTARFIDERIAVINRELGSTEQELESFKRSAGLTDLASDAQQALSEKSNYEKRRVENGTQIGLVDYLSDYLSNPINANEPLPVNVGLNDQPLTQLINQYNELILERNRLLRSSSESNPVVRKIGNSIRDMRESVATSIASVKKGLLIAKSDLDREATKFAGRISDAPTKERQYVSIQRQQEIKAGLYLMLLQKREENNITLAATSTNAKIIDDALSDSIPVSPKKKIILLLALVIGVGIPVGIIYILDLLKFRIENRSDVEKITSVPIIGDVPISTANQSDSHAIAVREGENDLMAETFRNIRTSLLFMLSDPAQKVILVTSTSSGEGKTFMASNLAVSLALLGKKVLIMGLDIRKPGLNKVFHISHKERGVTQYLSAPQSTSLDELLRPSGVVEGLDLIPGGAVPPNPTELLARPAFDQLLQTLRQRYDYIVMDTAPIGMITDTQVIARVADASIYVCRADYTHKADFQYINELTDRRVLPNLSVIVNGIDLSQKKYGYYYGYGKYGKYGYGKRYGYGYGYGYGKQD